MTWEQARELEAKGRANKALAVMAPELEALVRVALNDAAMFDAASVLWVERAEAVLARLDAARLDEARRP